MTSYDELKQRLAHGWNTWNTRSVLSHVLLPSGFALNLCLKEYADGQYLKEALIGRQNKDQEQIHPGPHAYDGAYTELTLAWKGIEIRIQSATESDHLVLLVTPLRNQTKPALLVVESGFLWNRPGVVQRDGDTLQATIPDQTVTIYATRASVVEMQIAAQTPYLALPLDGPVGLSTGLPRTLAEIEAIVRHQKEKHHAEIASFGDLAEVYAAVQTCLAWDTIYDPSKQRVVSPVSRIWNVNSGGYVLFCWDNYFAAYLAALGSRDLAYANAIEIMRERTDDGFVPNCAWANGVTSRDRSQPPVGALMVRELYRRFGERWLLEELFDDLLTWNRWWAERRCRAGLLAWGSNPYTPQVGNVWETRGVGDTFGGALESGLDNSPMYDDIPFDSATHTMQLADVGLNGLYLADCAALAEIAGVLGRAAEAAELRERRDAFAAKLQSLWEEPTGLFLNRRLDTGAFSRRLSPTHFYPLLGQAASPAQAGRMIREHLRNPDEFWGEWVLPSIARNDPAYPDQTYWRGRIWAPMNFLVYLGLRNYSDLNEAEQARRELAERSIALLLKEWQEHGHVHENYSADTGEGCDKSNSDRFYHWGGLLGLIALIEAGHLDGPERPLIDLSSKESMGTE